MHKDSVEAIVIQELIGVSSGMDASVVIYNMEDMVARQMVKLLEQGGFSQLQFSVVDPYMLLAASTEGEFYVIDSRNAKILKTYAGH